MEPGAEGLLVWEQTVRETLCDDCRERVPSRVLVGLRGSSLKIVQHPSHRPLTSGSFLRTSGSLEAQRSAHTSSICGETEAQSWEVPNGVFWKEGVAERAVLGG